MKLAILLVVGGIALLCVTGYLAYVDFANTVFNFFRNPQHYRIRQAAPQKELRFIRRNRTNFNNGTENERLRDRVLLIFNSVRRIIASGRIDALMKFVESLGNFQLNIPFGPASNMKLLEWSFELESIVKKHYDPNVNKITKDALAAQNATQNLKNSAQNFRQNPNLKTGKQVVQNVGKGIKQIENVMSMFNDDTLQKIRKSLSKIDIPGFHGFHWPGLLADIVKDLLGSLKIPKVRSAIDQILARADIAETLISLIYLATSYPTNGNVATNDMGPAAALVATRHEIGCWSNRIFAICIVRKDDATTMYEQGATCLSCPPGFTCEYRAQPDGTFMEGDMCVPDPNYVPPQNLTMNGTSTESSGTRALFDWNPLVLCAPRIKWKCLDAFNQFRSKAAAGQLNGAIHKAAGQAMDTKVYGFPDIDKDIRNNSLRALQMQIGPMANVKKLYWDENLVRSANKTAQKCPQVGGKRGEENREFSMYYDPTEQEDIGKMIAERLNFMTPWMKSVTPPHVNTTMYFYVAGEFFWATRERIGCVIATCKQRTLLECHMAPGNTLEGRPYIEGKPCSKCEDGYFCEENLCARGKLKPKGEESSKSGGEGSTSSYLTLLFLILLIA
ncbi:unnamed protein product [Caenorhabditis sp. 36 PRJEB53466]|nr:unnamed protein product [Caenorhabditis sp. 36 PRJEB53466]